MPRVIRSTDIVESIAEKALFYAFGGIFGLAFGYLLYYYRGEGWLIGLAWVLMLGGGAAIVISVYSALQVRKVTNLVVRCPFCEAVNQLLSTPEEDFNCVSCNRMIPIDGGKVMAVDQVRCGFCNSLNFYCAKTEILLCEECNHEIPIAQQDGRPTKKLPSGFAVTEDVQTYELQLVAIAHRSEELITCLQHMLALNRNQVKQMFEELPVTLLTGIPRKKAEMLSAQLAAHDASASFHPVGEPASA